MDEPRLEHKSSLLRRRPQNDDVREKHLSWALGQYNARGPHLRLDGLVNLHPKYQSVFVLVWADVPYRTASKDGEVEITSVWRWRGPKTQWPVRHGPDPTWGTGRALDVPEQFLDSALVSFEVWDKRESPVLVGAAKITLSELVIGEEVRLELSKQAGSSLKRSLSKGMKKLMGKDLSMPSTACAIRFHMVPDPPARRNVFFVRHGESVWNRAQADLDVATMMQRVDHPLNEAGRDQAVALRKRVEAALESADLPSEFVQLARQASEQTVWTRGSRGLASTNPLRKVKEYLTLDEQRLFSVVERALVLSLRDPVMTVQSANASAASTQLLPPAPPQGRTAQVVFAPLDAESAAPSASNTLAADAEAEVEAEHEKEAALADEGEGDEFMLSRQSESYCDFPSHLLQDVAKEALEEGEEDNALGTPRPAPAAGPGEAGGAATAVAVRPKAISTVSALSEISDLTDVTAGGRASSSALGMAEGTASASVPAGDAARYKIWKMFAADHQRDRDLEMMFWQCGEVWSSPLTRAVCTGLIVMERLFVDKEGRTGLLDKIVLRPSVREKRNFGGKDSTGEKIGEQIHAHVASEMRRLRPAGARPSERATSSDSADSVGRGSGGGWFSGSSRPSSCRSTEYTEVAAARAAADAEEALDPAEEWDQRAARLAQVKLDAGECQQKWWSTGAESTQDLLSRIHEFFLELKYALDCPIIVFGHSHYWRTVLNMCMNSKVDSALAAQLGKRKLMNCGVVYCHLNYDLGPALIEDFQLMFGTTLE